MRSCWAGIRGTNELLGNASALGDAVIGMGNSTEVTRSLGDEAAQMRDLGDALCVLESRSTALEGIIDGDASTRTQLLGNASKALGSASMLVDVELRSSRPSMRERKRREGRHQAMGDASQAQGDDGRKPDDASGLGARTCEVE
ncbi:unnamed protein product, partial [Ilex paraguariensis]